MVSRNILFSSVYVCCCGAPLAVSSACWVLCFTTLQSLSARIKRARGRPSAIRRAFALNVRARCQELHLDSWAECMTLVSERRGSACFSTFSERNCTKWPCNRFEPEFLHLLASTLQGITVYTEFAEVRESVAGVVHALNYKGDMSVKARRYILNRKRFSDLKCASTIRGVFPQCRKKKRSLGRVFSGFPVLVGRSFFRIRDTDRVSTVGSPRSTLQKVDDHNNVSILDSHLR